MEGIKTNSPNAKGGRTALVTYVTAGYPSPEETADILLGMEAGAQVENRFRQSELSI
jgi:tryptophan synthase